MVFACVSVLPAHTRPPGPSETGDALLDDGACVKKREPESGACPFLETKAGPVRGGPPGGAAVSRKQGASGRDVRYSVPPDAPLERPEAPEA